MATQSWDWVFHTLGWTLAGLGVLLGFWALFWDRSRGRKRCPRCWYSMEGAARGQGGECVCPECGKVIADDHKLHRTRRRPRWAVLSLIACVASYAVFVTPVVRRDGWVAVTPTSVLIAIGSPQGIKDIAFADSFQLQSKVALDNDVERELMLRGDGESIYDWQSDILAWRIRRASNDSAEMTEFKSYDISRLLSPSWWRWPVRFSSDDRAQLWTEFRYLWTRFAIPESWADNGGIDAALTRMGNRLYVWAPREQQRIVDLDLALFITDGKEGSASAPYWSYWEELRLSFEIRIYDVSDLAPPNVERFEMPPPDPNEDIQWGYSDGEIVVGDQAILDLLDDITQTVVFDKWIDNGGEEAMISTLPGRLVIMATPETHELVAQRLALLRIAMGGETGGTP